MSRRPGFRKRRRAMHWEPSGRTKGKEGRRRRTVERRSARSSEEPPALSRDELRRLEVLAEFSGFAMEECPELPTVLPIVEQRAHGWHIVAPEKDRERVRKWMAEHRDYRRTYEREYWRKPENALRHRLRQTHKRKAEMADPVRHAKRLASWAALGVLQPGGVTAFGLHFEVGEP